MEKEINYRITKTWRFQLQKFQREQEKYIIDRVISEKSFPGEDFVEITASDIQKHAKTVFFNEKINDRWRLVFSAINLYFILWLCFLAYGIFYEKLKLLLNQMNQNPQQFSYVFVGIVLMILSYFGKVFLKDKIDHFRRDEIRRTEIRRRMLMENMEELEKLTKLHDFLIRRKNNEM